MTYGHANLARYLINRGASIERPTKNGLTLSYTLLCQSHFSYLKSIQLLSLMDLCQVAVIYGHANVASYLINRGASIERLTKNGLTLSHLCCKNSTEEIAEILRFSGKPMPAGKEAVGLLGT